MIKNLIVSTLSILITIIGTAYYNSSLTLEYKDSVKEQYLNISNDVFKDLTLTYNKKRISNISMYQVAIFNKTWKDFENVNLYFTLKSKTNKKLPNIINKGFFAPSNRSSNIGISEIKKVKDNTYMVNIKVLKQTDTDKYYLGRFIFEGNEIPDVVISTPENIGLQVGEYSYTKERLIALLIILVFIIIIIIPLSILGNWDINRNWKKRREELENILKDTQQLDNKLITEIINSYENKYKPKEGYFYRKTLSIIKYFKN